MVEFFHNYPYIWSVLFWFLLMVICLDRIDIQICNKYSLEPICLNRIILAISEAIVIVFILVLLVFTGVFGAVVSFGALVIFIYLVVRIAFSRKPRD